MGKHRGEPQGLCPGLDTHQFKEDIEMLERRAAEVVQGLAPKSCAEWLKELEWFYPGKKEAQGRSCHSLQIPERRV